MASPQIGENEMKKLITIAMLSACAVAFAQDANRMSYVQLINPVVDDALDGPAVDISKYKGNAAFLAEWAANTETGHVASVTLQTSAASSSGWYTVTNINAEAVKVTKTGAYTNTAPDRVLIDSNRLKRYVRAVVAQTGATNAVSAMIVFPMVSN